MTALWCDTSTIDIRTGLTVRERRAIELRQIAEMRAQTRVLQMLAAETQLRIRIARRHA